MHGKHDTDLRAWIGSALGRLEAQPEEVLDLTCEAVLDFFGLLEIDWLPRPEIQALSAALIRLTWANGLRIIRVDIKSGLIEISTTHQNQAVFARLGHRESLTWIQKSRNIFRWCYPKQAFGWSRNAMIQEAEIQRRI